jgi:hypothetical protein
MEMLSAAKSSIAVTQTAVHADPEDLWLLEWLHIYFNLYLSKI